MPRPDGATRAHVRSADRQVSVVSHLVSCGPRPHARSRAARAAPSATPLPTTPDHARFFQKTPHLHERTTHLISVYAKKGMHGPAFGQKHMTTQKGSSDVVATMAPKPTEARPASLAAAHKPPLVPPPFRAARPDAAPCTEAADLWNFIVRAGATAHPDRIAVLNRDGSAGGSAYPAAPTYGKLLGRCASLAVALAELGAKGGDVVGVLAPNRAE
eukprot:955650-Prymnesium_polylepis.1